MRGFSIHFDRKTPKIFHSLLTTIFKKAYPRLRYTILTLQYTTLPAYVLTTHDKRIGKIKGLVVLAHFY